MMPTLSTLTAWEVVIAINCGAPSDDKVGMMTTLGFQFYRLFSKMQRRKGGEIK